MGKLMRGFGYLIVILICQVCTTTVDQLQVDPSFQYQAIQFGKMAVASVVSLVKPLGESQRLNYANLLRKSILAEQETYKVGFPGVIVNQVGEKPFGEMVAQFRKTGLLSAGQLKLLGQKIAGYRYLIFAIIENDSLSKNHAESTDQKTKEITVETTARRAVTASLQIYDMQLLKMVWSGSVDKSAANTNSYKKDEQKGLLKVINAIGNIAGKNTQPTYRYPSPPTFDEVLGRVFAGFAENFPKK